MKIIGISLKNHKQHFVILLKQKNVAPHIFILKKTLILPLSQQLHLRNSRLYIYVDCSR